MVVTTHALMAHTEAQITEQPTRRPGGFWPPCVAWMLMLAVLLIVGTIVTAWWIWRQ
jgi:hypothetical protein